MLFTFNALNSELDSNNQNANLLSWVGDRETAIANATKVTASNAIIATSDTGAKAGYNYINRVSSTKTNQYHLDVDYDGENFSVNFEVGTTKAEGGTYRETSWEYVTAADAPGGYDYDLTGDPNLDFTNIGDGTDASKFVAGWIWGGAKPTTDEETFTQLDFDIPVDLGMITDIKTGVKYRSAKRTQGRHAYSWHAPFTDGGGADWGVY